MEILLGTLSALAVCGMCAICYLVFVSPATKKTPAPVTDVLESRIRRLELEWTDTFDKITRLTSRLAKERGLAAAAAAVENSPPEIVHNELSSRSRQMLIAKKPTGT